MQKVRFGEVVSRVSVKNKDGAVPISAYMSVSNEKVIVPSLIPGKIEGTNSNQYLVIKEGQFAYRTVVNPGCGLNIGRMREKIGLVSGSYVVFDFVGHEIVEPEYFRLYVSSNHFDSYVNRIAHGSARLALNWNQFCNLELEVPGLEVQQEVVRKFQVVEELIATKRSIYQNLLKTVDAIFRDMFMEDSGQGLKLKVFGPEDNIMNYCTAISGARYAPEDTAEQRSSEKPYPVFLNSSSIESVFGFSSFVNVQCASVNVTTKGYAGLVYMRYAAHYVANECKSLTSIAGKSTPEYLALLLKNTNLPLRGTTQARFCDADLRKLKFSFPSFELMESFSVKVRPLLELVETLVNEILELTDLRKFWLKSFDLDKLGKCHSGTSSLGTSTVYLGLDNILGSGSLAYEHY